MKIQTVAVVISSLWLTQVLLGAPAINSWQQKFQTSAYQRKMDWVFLVNRGWLSGHIIKLDNQNVTIKTDDKNETFSRKDISLIFLSDFLNTKKRTNKNEIKLRIELTGTAECGSIGFSQGTIIKRVDSAPKYTKGGDKNDKKGTNIMGIWFEKGSKDRSETTVSCDVTLLLGNPKTLFCNIHANRANCTAGQFTIRFLFIRFSYGVFHTGFSYGVRAPKMSLERN